jgi:hypothetical protein
MPCTVDDNPYVVSVPDAAPEAQVCVGTSTRGRNVASRSASSIGVFDALPAEWASCARPDAATAPTGRRLPTHQEMATALAKSPERWVTTLGAPGSASALGAGSYLSHTPAQVVCGYALGDDEHNPWWDSTWRLTAVNVNFDRWINGKAETWSKGASWQPTPRYSWHEPQVFTFNTDGQQPSGDYSADGPCERTGGDLQLAGHGDNLIQRGFTQCVVNYGGYRDWCYGHRNYKGQNLTADGQQLRVWAAHSLVSCPSQQVDPATARRPLAAAATGCEPDSRPTGKDWEIPACKTPAGRWTQCGTAWLDALLPPPAPLPTPTTTTSSSTTTAPTTAVAPPSSTTVPSPPSTPVAPTPTTAGPTTTAVTSTTSTTTTPASP